MMRRILLECHDMMIALEWIRGHAMLGVKFCVARSLFLPFQEQCDCVNINTRVRKA